MFLLFTVGLETSPSDLIRVGSLSLGVAFAGVLPPFATGLLFLRLNKEPRQEAAFVAAAMVATSVGITARVLRDGCAQIAFGADHSGSGGFRIYDLRGSQDREPPWARNQADAALTDAPLVLALALCLGLSVAATWVGMAAIIGAFFAGLAFADYSPQWNLEPRA